MKRQTVVAFLAISLGLIANPAAAGIWSNWQWLNPRPQGHTLRGVAASESVVVAVGDGGTVLISENGTTWDIAHSKSGLDLWDVIWTGEKFFAVGGISGGGKSQPPSPSHGIILTSDEGRDWAVVHYSGLLYFTKVIFNGEAFVAVGVKGSSATSTDGLNWVNHDIEEPFNSGMIDIAWNGSTFVALGGGFWGISAIYLSDDGGSWTMASLDGLPPMGFDSVIWTQGRFLAYGGWKVISSTDGISWVLESSTTGVAVHEILATPQGYLGVGGTKFLESPDGLNWNASDVFPEPRGIYDLIQFQGKLIIVGADGAITVSADQGLRWESATIWEIDTHGSSSISDLCQGDGILIAIKGGVVFRSLNGIDWQEVTVAPSIVSSVRRIDDAFWLVGNHRFIAHSFDGATWTPRSHEYGADYWDIASSGETMVAVGNKRSPHHAVVATSTDGYAWNEIEIDDGDDLAIRSVAWTGNCFVAVGTHGSLFRSDDGYQWEIGALDLNGYSLSYVVSNGSVLVGVGSVDFLISEDDGLTWRPTLFDTYATDLIWTGELFIAVGRGSVFSSRNGEDWVASPVGFAGGANAVEWHDGKIIVAGYAANLLRAELYPTAPPLEFPQDSAPD